jgi:hypothetical protein
MALKVSHKIKHNGVDLLNGHCYKFNYANFENDPNPHVFFINAIRGLNPDTGKRWNLIQAINLNYLPRSIRRRFVDEWQDSLRRTKGNFRLTWLMVLRKFPYFRNAIRRYYLQPRSYISRLKYINADEMEGEIIRSFHKDFSKGVKRINAGRSRAARKGRR